MIFFVFYWLRGVSRRRGVCIIDTEEQNYRVTRVVLYNVREPFFYAWMFDENSI